MTLSPGARLGPYEILARIGQGGMGVGDHIVDPVRSEPRCVALVKTMGFTVNPGKDSR